MTHARLHDPTHAELMRALQAGEALAFGELYDRLAHRAYSTALAVCHDHECAQEAVQDAFLSIWTSRASYHADRGPVAAWAMSVVRHRAIHLARHRTLAGQHGQATSRLDEHPAQDDVPMDFAARADHQQLTELLALLPAAQQQVIQLGFFDGLTHQEIAQRLALAPGTVKGRMRLGLNKLRVGLDATDPPAAEVALPHPDRIEVRRLVGRLEPSA